MTLQTNEQLQHVLPVLCPRSPGLTEIILHVNPTEHVLYTLQDPVIEFPSVSRRLQRLVTSGIPIGYRGFFENAVLHNLLHIETS